jgi:beta-lactamase class A
MVSWIEPMMLHRRALLGSALTGLVAVAAGCGARPRSAAPSAASSSVAPAVSALAQLERRFDGRLGVCAIDTGSGVSVSYRAEERFLMCSTGKVLSVAAVQHLASGQPGLLDRLIEYAQSDVLKWAPVTSQHVADGMTVAALCDAAITMSDNTAANLLVELLGGPQKVTAFARSIGDQVTSIDRLEPELNVGTPGDTRDTSTPAQMAANLHTVVLGAGLVDDARDRLTALLKANTTGGQQIRAGVPAGWAVGDKTGSGAAAESNDIGVVWRPGASPLIISVYTAPVDPHVSADRMHAVIAQATRIAVSSLAPTRR